MVSAVVGDGRRRSPQSVGLRWFMVLVCGFGFVGSNGVVCGFVGSDGVVVGLGLWVPTVSTERGFVGFDGVVLDLGTSQCSSFSTNPIADINRRTRSLAALKLRAFEDDSENVIQQSSVFLVITVHHQFKVLRKRDKKSPGKEGFF
nr:hypothetical protein CFP56_06032 [Quercus suber]